MQTVQVGVKRPEVRCSKWYASTTDPFEAMILMFWLHMVSDKSLRNEFSYGLITWAKFRPLKCTSKLHFQMLTPPRIKLIWRTLFSSFCCDIPFQSFEYVSAFHKIKFAKFYFGSEKTCIECTCESSFYVQYIKWVVNLCNCGFLTGIFSLHQNYYS